MCVFCQPLHHRHDLTQGQLFLKWNTAGENSDFPSARLVVLPRLKNLVYPTIYS